MRGLVDTSIFIAQEAGRDVGALPDEGAISVITVAELHVGVLRAKDAKTRARRLLTLARAERDFEAIAIDSTVARVYATIAAQARSEGRRPQAVDVWIAATAVRHELILYTHDVDFRTIPQVKVFRSAF